MKPAGRFGYFAIVFAVAAAIAYLLAVWNNYALFTYHPVPGEVGWGVEKSRDGPAMYWYGWMSTAALAGLAACAIAACLPRSVADRVSAGWTSAVALVVLALFSYLLKGYFLN